MTPAKFARGDWFVRELRSGIGPLLVAAERSLLTFLKAAISAVLGLIQGRQVLGFGALQFSGRKIV